VKIVNYLHRLCLGVAGDLHNTTFRGAGFRLNFKTLLPNRPKSPHRFHRRTCAGKARAHSRASADLPQESSGSPFPGELNPSPLEKVDFTLRPDLI
jgi:hypothetical protein